MTASSRQRGPPRIVAPELVRVAPCPAADPGAFNTVVKPFKDVFHDPVRLLARNANEAQQAIFGHVYELRVVEALVGMWLSRVTYYVLGSAAAAYDGAFVALVDRALADGLRQHAATGGSGTPNFPDVYQAGEVPPGYDSTQFDPDQIYPGQRFAILRPAEEIVFDEGTTVTGFSPSVWDGVWVAAIWGAQAEILFGAHDAYGPVLNVGDIVRYGELRRFGGICAHGWDVGLGVGASSGATVLIYVNYPSLESLNETTDDGWDWDVAVGAKVPKGASKYAKVLFEAIRSLKHMQKFEKTGKKGEVIKTAVETLIKNLKGGLPSGGQKLLISIPVPFTGPGLNLWVGKKATQYETFWTRGFMGDRAPEP